MEDTICAVATGANLGAIAIIRLSGRDAIAITNSLFSEKDLTKVASHTIHYGHLVFNDEIIDEVLVSIMKAPKTYTKEDIVEINCHGGINTTTKILEVLLNNGCRLAEPGEFTKRAFLNGRISLIEAESINDLIKSQNDASRIMALNNMGGKLTQKIRDIRAKMAKVLANIEVNIDYPEYEDEVEVTHTLLAKYLTEFATELNALKENAANGKIINDGINIAIIGKPNVGKCSILNFLLDEEKAIVTDIPGTTRDIVEGSITLNGVKLNFIDTAGIRETTDTVEKIGVNKSRQMASQADLVIFCLNNNTPITPEEMDLLKSLNKEDTLIFINKNDLSKKIDTAPIADYDIIWGNTITDNGLDELKKAIIKKYSLEKIVNKDMSYLSNVRQIDLITKAVGAINNAQKAHEDQMEVDIIEIDLKQAWNYLGELIGDAYTDELVDNIFSNFCLGK